MHVTSVGEISTESWVPTTCVRAVLEILCPDREVPVEQIAWKAAVSRVESALTMPLQVVQYARNAQLERLMNRQGNKCALAVQQVNIFGHVYMCVQCSIL